ncbi:MAG: DUF1289 domain-containing protein [Paracoccaceae bacterium]|nr:DUF1289 domain-containing protein [Paracoccaceae bacterium]MDG1738806.1 DUF1289 domain-containing protein [Paracoccaceae bacterium]MDG2259379.1 DUF1289 domain-containing protein [Paracoccaceae bacterium]
MTDKIWQRDEVESPCINICVVHPAARICTGCFRTIEEISDWSRMTPTQRREVISDLPNRTSQLSKRRGGRSARLKR